MASISDKPKKNAPPPHQEDNMEVTHTPLQTLFLSRLAWYNTLKRQYKADPACEEWKTKALDLAIYSTFRDCEDQGVLTEAKELLHMAQDSSKLQ